MDVGYQKDLGHCSDAFIGKLRHTVDLEFEIFPLLPVLTDGLPHWMYSAYFLIINFFQSYHALGNDKANIF